jgi:hypothetical protein
MYSLEEIADRLEITDRIALYCHAMDDGDFDALDQVFASDAVLDYRALGLPPLTWVQLKDRLKAGEPAPFDQHVYSNIHIVFAADRATAEVKSKVFNPQGMPGADGRIHFFGSHGDYHDVWHRTEDGWRIRTRYWSHQFFSGDYPFTGRVPRATQFAQARSTGAVVENARASWDPAP